jgi:hypothetical protein
VDGAAFGGPIFYGHAAESFNEKPDHPGNVYWYQAVRANEVFKMLDGKQREVALRKQGRMEQGPETVKLSGKTEGLPGIPMTELSQDQRGLVRKVMADLLAPFRKQDSDEALKYIEAAWLRASAHGLSTRTRTSATTACGMSGNSKGPNMVWYFRGDPHVHVWVNVKAPA